MIRIRNVTLRRAALRTRMPFRYGIAEMKELPHVFVVLEAEIGGTVSRGIAADHLPPKWFTKDPDRELAGEIADMGRRDRPRRRGDERDGGRERFRGVAAAL